MSSSPGNSFYFSLCLTALYQGEPGPKGDKGDRGMTGEAVSTAERGHESGQFWRERVGQAPSVAGVLPSSEIATVVLIFVLPVEEAA